MCKDLSPVSRHVTADHGSHPWTKALGSMSPPSVPSPLTLGAGFLPQSEQFSSLTQAQIPTLKIQHPAQPLGPCQIQAPWRRRAGESGQRAVPGRPLPMFHELECFSCNGDISSQPKNAVFGWSNRNLDSRLHLLLQEPMLLFSLWLRRLYNII